ncbi:MAG: hypothetical protein GY906_15930 [bacterium]|nr:hypothetical protein [bacterium]
MSSNNGGIHFFKTTILGGLVFLVPVVVFIVVLAKAAGLMMMVAEPMAAWLPADTIGGVALANVIAVAAVVLLCFAAGLVARAAFIRASVEGLESKVLMKVPGYVLLKGMIGGLQEGDTHDLKPVMIQIGASYRVALEIERMDDGRVIVLVPSSPNPWSGPVQVNEAEDVRRLDISMVTYMDFIQGFGQGANDFLCGKNMNEPTGNTGSTTG